ncbi:MAG: hypothetical protein AB1345_01935 [Chloroflexota bacterium]
MTTYRVETTISKDKTISIKDLPFSEGDKVEVIVRSCQYKKYHQRYPLRGQPIKYIKPFESVAEGEWGILQ